MKRRLEEGWLSFQRQVVPALPGPIQVDHLKVAFYGGATCMMATIVNGLGGGGEPTSEDLEMMEDLKRETEDFRDELALRAGVMGTPKASA